MRSYSLNPFAMNDEESPPGFQELPRIDVEMLEGELRRTSERHHVPERLLYVAPDGHAHRLDLSISRADKKLAHMHTAHVIDASFEGARAFCEHRYPVGTKLIFTATSVSTEETMFRIAFVIRNRRSVHVEISESEVLYTYGTTVDKSLEKNTREVYHYGLAFIHDSELDTVPDNLLYKAFLDTLYLQFRLLTEAD